MQPASRIRKPISKKCSRKNKYSSYEYSGRARAFAKRHGDYIPHKTTVQKAIKAFLHELGLTNMQIGKNSRILPADIELLLSKRTARHEAVLEIAKRIPPEKLGLLVDNFYPILNFLPNIETLAQCRNYLILPDNAGSLKAKK